MEQCGSQKETIMGYTAMDEELDYINLKREYNAPTREQLLEITDLSYIDLLIDEATDIIISIQTQLEYLDDGDDNLKQRRVNSLIYWKIVQKNCKQRIVMIRMAEEKKGKKENGI